jgi:hypothetical protein
VSNGSLELADIVRRFGARFVDKYGAALSFEQRRALRDIANCRTAALGGHVYGCAECGHRQVAYNSCRNRHCPKCQAAARVEWLSAREQELLPVPYFHVVFTLPPELNELALQNPSAVYGLLFQAASQTLLQVARNPDRLGAKIGFLSVLHTWGQNLMHHPHLHCVVPGGGLSPDGTSWVPCRRSQKRRRREFFLPVRILSRVFRGKFIAGLKDLAQAGSLKFFGKLQQLAQTAAFENLLNQSVRRDWVVYAKRPFGGPLQVLKYLARYTHRVAISNQRLMHMDDEHVAFHYKDYADQNRTKVLSLDGTEFLRRFLMHVLPRGFVRIRHYGLLANRHRNEHLSLCRRLLGVPESITPASLPADSPPPDAVEGSASVRPCPVCKTGRLQRIEIIPAVALVIIPWPHSLPQPPWESIAPGCDEPGRAHSPPGVDTS